MKNIQVTFTEEEFEKLKKDKDEKGLTWHDYILSIVEED